MIKTSLSSHQKIDYIRRHMDVFEVDNNLYPLEIFENFVETIEKTIERSVLELSCKIERDKIEPARFNIGFALKSQEQLKAVFNFFSQGETRVDVKINYSLFQKFIGDDFDFSKMIEFMLGVDVRQELGESRLKLCLTIANYPEKQAAAIALNDHLDREIQALLISEKLHMGFDFSLKGQSEIELYPYITKKDFQRIDIQHRLAQVLSPAALQPLPACSRICVGFSKANADKVVYYYLENINDFFNYFAVNDSARRVHAYYREQPVREMCVALPEREFKYGTIQKMNLYYLI